VIDTLGPEAFSLTCFIDLRISAYASNVNDLKGGWQ
jgi:hypothetical protein